MHQLSHSQYDSVRDSWKLITVLIGANNLCGLCASPSTGLPQQATADEYEKHLRLALHRLRAEVKHAFVNLLALFSVSLSKSHHFGESVLEAQILLVFVRYLSSTTQLGVTNIANLCWISQICIYAHALKGPTKSEKVRYHGDRYFTEDAS